MIFNYLRFNAFFDYCGKSVKNLFKDYLHVNFFSGK